MGQMMQMPLLISSLIVHAARHSGDTEIVSKRVEGDLHRYTWRDVERVRARLRRPWHAWAASRRPRRHAGLERLPPHGDLLRQLGLGPGVPHDQPAPLSRADRLDRQRRGRTACCVST
jgi:hypothetical protein